MNGPVKAEVKVGERGVEKLIDAAVDAFSPAIETLGLPGDAVRLARIEVAAIVTRRAKAIADSQGLTLTAPPLKFLVPFYEKASTENVDDDTLVEMWARLLTSAGSDFNARHLRYSTLLSEMSATQARLLQGIAHNYGGVVGRDVDQDALFFELVESRLVGRLKSIKDHEIQKIFESVFEMICLPGVIIVITQFELKSNKEIYDWTDDELYYDNFNY